MKIETRGAEAFMRAPRPELGVILVYGPDAGLVRERARGLAKNIVPDLGDPFRFAEFTADDLLGDPARLSDEVAAIAMTGGRRAIMVREAGDGFSSLLGQLLTNPPCRPPQAALVVVEAGNLPPRSTLRDLCERADNAAALPCYADEGAQLGELIRRTLAAERVTASSEALRFLADNLGGDRMVTMRELEKLAVYAGPGGTVELEDAVAVVGDSSALSMEEVSLAAAGGEFAALDRALSRVFLEGAQPIAVLRSVTRHFDRLRQAAAAIEGGANDEAAMAALRPAVFFKQKPRFRDQIKRWSAARASDALALLIETEILCKTTGMPAETICRQALFDLAQQLSDPKRRATGAR